MRQKYKIHKNVLFNLLDSNSENHQADKEEAKIQGRTRESLYMEETKIIWQRCESEAGLGTVGNGTQVEQMASLDRFDPGNIEGGMNSHGPRELQANSGSADDLRNGEWPHKPGSQHDASCSGPLGNDEPGSGGGWQTSGTQW